MDNITYDANAIYNIAITNTKDGKDVFSARTDALIVIANECKSDGMHAVKMFNCDGMTVCSMIHGMMEMLKILEKNYPIEYSAIKLRQLLYD